MKASENKKIREMIRAALFTALVFLATNLGIPNGMGGHANFGDVFVLLGGFLLGPVAGTLAGAVGSALADLVGGYMIYVPATFLIKGLMALTVSLAVRLIGNRSSVRLLSAIGAEAIMMIGYYLNSAVFIGFGWIAPLANIPGNAVQAFLGIFLSLLCERLFMKIPALNHEFGSGKEKKEP